MRLTLSLCVFVSVCLLQGCWVSSINPLAEYDSPAMIALPEVEGTWVASKNFCEDDEKDPHPCILRIRREMHSAPYAGAAKPRYYEIEQESLSKVKFRATIVQLGPYRFLDTTPAYSGLDEKVTFAYMFHLFATHTFWKMELEGDTLLLAQPDTDYLYERWHSKPPDNVAVHYDCGFKSDCYLFTAKTPELQKLYLKYAGNPKAFRPDHKFVFKRTADAKDAK